MKYFVIKILKSLFVTVFLHFRPPPRHGSLRLMAATQQEAL